MIKKGEAEDGVYKTLLKTAQMKVREEHRERKISFFGEGRGRGGLSLPTF